MKIKFPQIFGAICFALAILVLFGLPRLFLEWKKLESGILSFWEMTVYQDGDSITLKKDGIFYIWEVKSAFLDWDNLYILYYYPFDIVKYEENRTVYEFGPLSSLKEWPSYEKYPYYLIYNKITSKIAYLNSNKAPLQSSEIDYSDAVLKKLDQSNSIDIWKLYQTTMFVDTQGRYGKLAKEFNDHLNLQLIAP